jgi:glycosyltransferase involved in cell wall biosynthesis
MKISGFTMVRNAEKLYFPIKESIQSVLPIVDEFIVALGEGDDNTRGLIESIGSDKIKIYDRQWHEKDFVESRIFAQETNFALQQCSGDWCFYIQADEVVHEQDLPRIAQACHIYLPDQRVDGLLFKYLHFFGDYDHYLPFHGWYKNEIRIIRNRAGIYSFRDAQSFRKGENQKLNVVALDAHVYHYGWVRPPHLMQRKKQVHDSIHHGVDKTEKAYRLLPNEFDYGPLGRVPRFPGTHPAVMAGFIKKMDWQQKLNYARSGKPDRGQMKHEKWKYRVISFLENTLNGGRDFVGYTNWHIIK